MTTAEPGGDGDRPFSVLLPVHGGDDSEQFRTALESVLDQTSPPTEVVVAGDATVGRTHRAVVEQVKRSAGPTVRYLGVGGSQPLGTVLRAGVRACEHEWVARMDADDVAVGDRFEQQFAFLAANPGVDVAGGVVAEFDEDPERPQRVRTVPTDPEAVRRSARRRCPVNHPTVLFRRATVLRAGNYRSEYDPLEDYDLWLRVLAAGGVIANQDDVLVRMRAGEGLADRRGGLDYLRAEWRLFEEFRRQGVLDYATLARNLAVRVPVRLATPRLRGLVYRTLLRRSPGHRTTVTAGGETESD
jgi:glycosyltransferase involved in cell wall biosynthesis